MDIYSKQKRSDIMRLVHLKNTSTELSIRRAIHKIGLRYSLHRKDLPGTPDLVFRRFKTIMYVNGCMWHGHCCKRGHLPKSNIQYWENKIIKNIRRDSANIMESMMLGWKVLVVWECAIRGKSTNKIIAVANECHRFLLSEEKYLEISGDFFKK